MHHCAKPQDLERLLAGDCSDVEAIHLGRCVCKHLCMSGPVQDRMVGRCRRCSEVAGTMGCPPVQHACTLVLCRRRMHGLGRSPCLRKRTHIGTHPRPTERSCILTLLPLQGL